MLLLWYFAACFQHGSEIEKLLLESSAAVEDEEEAEDLDTIIEGTFAEVEKNKFITNDFVDAIPQIQQRYIVSVRINE